MGMSAKRRRQKLLPQIRGLIFGMIAIAVLGAFYYFLYIDQQREVFDAKRFRVLATQGQNLTERHQQLFEYAYRQYQDANNTCLLYTSPSPRDA